MFKNLKNRLRNYFITGLLITLPIAFTIFILNFLFRILDGSLSPMFTRLLIMAGALIKEGYRIPGLGVFMTLVIIFLVGVVTTNVMGAKLLQLGEKILDRIPVVRNIYTGAKQIVTTIAATDTKAFSEVVMVEFPRKGIWSLGFITSKTRGEVQEITDEEVVNIFIPTTPNPTSGFLIFVPRKDTSPLHMTVEEGIKMVISCGIVTPKMEDRKQLHAGETVEIDPHPPTAEKQQDVQA